MEIVSISGHAGSGKDTVAGIIKERLEHDDRKVLITHYADLLKYICKTFFNWNGKKDERGREILQYVGTDIIRKQDENYWVDFLISIPHCIIIAFIRVQYIIIGISTII